MKNYQVFVEYYIHDFVNNLGIYELDELERDNVFNSQFQGLISSHIHAASTLTHLSHIVTNSNNIK